MRSLVTLLFGLSSIFGQESSDSAALTRGVKAFKNAQYYEATAAFQQAVARNPNNVQAHLYLGTVYMTQWIPGAESPERQAFGVRAEAEFKRVLELSPDNKTAIASLASLSYNQAQSLPFAEKLPRLEEARVWYKRLSLVDPTNKEPFYSLGVIAWAEFYPALMAARAQLNMRPEQPGPLTNPSVRSELRARYSVIIEEGIANFNRALDIDPKYDDAMAYLNLLIRERADLVETSEEYTRDIAAADAWVQKALATKKEKAAAFSADPVANSSATLPPVTPGTIIAGRLSQAAPSSGVSGGIIGGIIGAAPLPASPPPPAPADAARNGGGGSASPVRIRVAGSDQAQKLVSQTTPEYPPLARQAKIQGTVRFSAIINKDGSINNLQLVSGHPQLVQPAVDAVKQWIYQPTLLNGQPVEVITQIEVNFSLEQ